MPGPGLDLVGDEELAELTDVIRSGRPEPLRPRRRPFPAKVRRFEEAVAGHASVRYALAVNSGTSALYLALAGLGVGPGDEVIVPGFTYVATISADRLRSSPPVLAEIDDTLNLDPADVEARITPRTRAISPSTCWATRPASTSCVPSPIATAWPSSRTAAQAFGATYRGRWVGSHGAAGIYSFNEYKTITCGDGGMLVTDDEALYRAASPCTTRATPRCAAASRSARDPFLGLNFRMTELEGAVLLAQVRKLDRIRQHLRVNRDLVRAIIEDLPGIGFRDAARPRWRPGHAPGRHLPGRRDGASRHRGARLDHARPLRLARLHPHGAPARAAHGDRHGCPSTAAAPMTEEAAYRRGHAAGTDALLARSMSFGIGVSDPNLAPFGLRMRDDAEVARARAAQFRDVASTYLAG